MAGLIVTAGDGARQARRGERAGRSSPFHVPRAGALIATFGGVLGSVAGEELLLLAASLTGWNLRTPQSAAYLFCGGMALGALVAGWLLVSRAKLPETLAGRFVPVLER